MKTHPYADLPDRQFWRRGVSSVESFRIDPVNPPRFKICRGDRIATAGSCFAQHISSRLKAFGFNYFVAEDGAGIAESDRENLGYGVFSARYGNIYTVRQLLQLVEECFDAAGPKEGIWETSDGRYVDALRPQIQPGGFASKSEVREERVRHRIHVRRLFRECDVLVFTLGLTECWRSRHDGKIFPIAPGVVGGTFDASRHEFVNLDAPEVTDDLHRLLGRLKEIRPSIKVVLTVSPVPLIATFEDRHVLVSNTYSKSVLRVAAEAVCRSRDWVEYFPSYEIITGNFTESAYYDADFRNVNAKGVDHVMRTFLRNFIDEPDLIESADAGYFARAAPHLVCDEEALEETRRL